MKAKTNGVKKGLFLDVEEVSMLSALLVFARFRIEELSDAIEYTTKVSDLLSFSEALGNCCSTVLWADALANRPDFLQRLKQYTELTKTSQAVLAGGSN